MPTVEIYLLMTGGKFFVTICPDAWSALRDMANVYEDLATVETVEVELKSIYNDRNDGVPEAVDRLLEIRDEHGGRPFAKVIDGIVAEAFKLGRQLGKREATPAA